ncbi:Na(+)/H(+) antiporter subunit G [alpha proteobacterium U9-1i]|nr:Na(+)/H(+) antiporter subunit G [alpha proteobacterium U9-1i]
MLLEALRQGASAILIVVGLVFVAGGLLGLLRFPDFYTRLHAVTTSDGIGAVLVVVGLAIGAANLATALKLLVLATLIGAVAPTLAHLAANAAHAAGLAPLAGRYTAPRPGARR